MDVVLAQTPQQIAACYAVMKELRTDLLESQFVHAVQTQMMDGYRLAYLAQEGIVVAVAGFRILSNLAWGHHMYIEDLVTMGQRRSRGCGRALFHWLRQYAQSQGCGQIHLDSGVQRFEAHRFYLREGMCIASHHFAMVL